MIGFKECFIICPILGGLCTQRSTFPTKCSTLDAADFGPHSCGFASGSVSSRIWEHFRTTCHANWLNDCLASFRIHVVGTKDNDTTLSLLSFPHSVSLQGQAKLTLGLPCWLACISGVHTGADIWYAHGKEDTFKHAKTWDCSIAPAALDAEPES